MLRSFHAVMDSFAKILDALGGTTAVAAAIDVPPTTVASWKSRGSVPPVYWSELVKLARKKGAAGVSLQRFAEIAASAATAA